MYRAYLLGVCLALLCGCAGVSAPDNAYTRAEANIADWGAILDLRSGRQIDANQLLDELAAAQTVMVGEIHDNFAHHLIEQWLVEHLAERRAQGAVVLEMLNSDQQRAVSEVQAWLAAGNQVHPSRLRQIMHWDIRWGWAQYGMLVNALMHASAPVLAGNLSASELKRLSTGTTPDSSITFPSQAIADAQRQRIEQMHCASIEPARMNVMLAIQRGRDLRMAQVLDSSPQPRLLIAGALHVLKRHGAAQYLAQGPDDSGLKVLVIGEEGQVLAPQDADYFWLLPRNADDTAMATITAGCTAPAAPTRH